MATTRGRPKRPNGSARSRRHVEPRAAWRGIRSKVGADTGVEPGGDEIGSKGAEREERRRDQHRTTDYRVVARDDGVVDELPGPRAGKDDLGEDGAREQMADADPEDRYGGQHGELQRVAQDDPALGQAEGARSSDMVLAKDLEHRGAHQAGEVADPAEADREGRQDEMGELVAEMAGFAGADRRQPVERDGEDEKRVERDDEGRHRDRCDGENAAHPVEPGATADRRPAAQRDAEHDRPTDAAGGQHDRIGQGFEDNLAHLAVGKHIDAEIAAEDSRKEGDELYQD